MVMGMPSTWAMTELLVVAEGGGGGTISCGAAARAMGAAARMKEIAVATAVCGIRGMWLLGITAKPGVSEPAREVSSNAGEAPNPKSEARNPTQTRSLKFSIRHLVFVSAFGLRASDLSFLHAVSRTS